MKNAVYVILSLAMFSFSARAEESCESCREMAAIVASNDLLRAQRFLSEFTLSKSSAVAAQESEAVTRLCAKFIPKEPESDTDEFCYDIFNQNPKLMKLAWLRQPEEQRRILQDSYDAIKALWANGNGGGAERGSSHRKSR